MVAKQLLPPPARKDKELKDDHDQPLAIRGSEGMLINYARCCNPIPGDTIVGFFTTGRGIVIHTTDCPNAKGYRKQPDKWVPVEWDVKVSGGFPVILRVEVHNQRGVLAKIASVIAEQESNINNVNVDERDGQFPVIRFVIEVVDRAHLALILRQIRTVPSVVRVFRAKG
jgi:(p)ppGpp synthase/HD superfamily hydrolase